MENNAGQISAKSAAEKADEEYKKYRIEHDKQFISDFDQEVKKLTKNNNESKR